MHAGIIINIVKYLWVSNHTVRPYENYGRFHILGYIILCVRYMATLYVILRV